MLPTAPLDGMLVSFGSNAANFVLATPDGRVRTYDTVTGRLRSTLATGGLAAAGKNAGAAANGNLAETQESLTWVDSPAPAAAGAQNGNAASYSCVAIGTSGGSVQVYDSATGELKWTAARTNEGGTVALTHTPHAGGALFACSPDGTAVSLNTATGKPQQTLRASKHGASTAAMSADGRLLLVGAATLCLWQHKEQHRLIRLAGHPLPVRAAAFSPDASCVLSAADGERLVAVWVLPKGAAASKKKTIAVAAASLAVPAPVVRVVTSPAGPAALEGSFYAAATTQEGEVVAWLIRPVGEAAVDVQQVARLCVDPGHVGTEVIFAAALEPRPEGATLLAAVGTAVRPRFERVPLGTKAVSNSKVTFLQPPPEEDGLIRPGAAAARAAAVAGGGSAAAGAAAAAPQVLGADNAGELVVQRLSRKRRGEEAAAADGGAQDAAAAAAAFEDDDDEEEQQAAAGEATLGQRVHELEKQHQQLQLQGGGADQQQQAAAAAAVAAAAEAGGADAAAAAAGPLKADSLAVLLSQALRSSDKALLERCLAVGRQRVIVNSVRRLVPMDAALLLRAAVERLQSRPRRGQQLAAWIQAVLLHHTAYLMAAPAAAPLMSSLYQIIEARLAMQRQLLSLSGRLELLLAQRGPGEAGSGGAGAVNAQGVAVYQESDSEAEVEIVDAGGADDDDDVYTTDDEGEDGLGSSEDGGDGGDGSSSGGDSDSAGPGSGGGSDTDMADEDEDAEE